MDKDAPGLFEMAAVDSPAARRRRAGGRRGETWRVTTSATVTVVDADSVRDAFAQYEADVIVLATDPDGRLPEDERPASALDQLGWMLWPTEGLEAAVESDAVWLRSVESEVVESSDAEGTPRWSVLSKPRDVEALRRLALAAPAVDASVTREDFGAAWRAAVDVYAPVRGLPGIEWQPGGVEVEHVPARSRR